MKFYYFLLFLRRIYYYSFMEYTNCEEFRRADIIIDAVCKVGGISYFQFLNEPKNTTISTLRGVCCVVAWEYKIHARRLSRLIHRTRGNVLNQTKKYRGFLQAKDPLTTDIYNKVKNEIKLQINGKD